MEDIKKAIEEEAKEMSCREVLDEPYKILLKGANLVLSRWEESERWRKVEEELPEDNKDVLGRGKSGKIVVVFYSNVDKCFLSNTTYAVLSITEWKPIH